MAKNHDECPEMETCKICEEVKGVVYLCNSKTAQTFCKDPDKLPVCSNPAKAERGCPFAVCCADSQ